ncbi:MAG: REP element-mobilizing transposase RayT [Neolewinella sp.]
MVHAFTQVYIHAVFAVKFRQALILPDWEDSLHKFLCAKLIELEHSPIIVNGTEDHIHALWRHNRNWTIPETLKRIKGSSSHWINQEDLTDDLFRWQHGYGAFSVSPHRVGMVKGYVGRQKEHHKKTTLRNEYDRMLLANQIENLADFRFDPLI